MMKFSTISACIVTALCVLFTAGCATHSIQPLTPQVVRVDRQTVMLFPSDDLFETNTAILTQTGYATLNNLVKLLKKDSANNIHISAHTDPIDSQLIFQHALLSEQQAKVVAGYLWANGIQQHRITYSGENADHPIATNKKLVGMATNRRIQITTFPAVKSPNMTAQQTDVLTLSKQKPVAVASPKVTETRLPYHK